MSAVTSAFAQVLLRMEFISPGQARVSYQAHVQLQALPMVARPQRAAWPQQECWWSEAACCPAAAYDQLSMDVPVQGTTLLIWSGVFSTEVLLWWGPCAAAAEQLALSEGSCALNAMSCRWEFAYKLEVNLVPALSG